MGPSGRGLLFMAMAGKVRVWNGGRGVSVLLRKAGAM
jgi:hypothetical protein